MFKELFQNQELWFDWQSPICIASLATAAIGRSLLNQGFQSVDSGLSTGEHSAISTRASTSNFSVIRSSLISDNSKIGSFVEINRSVIDRNSVIPHHNYIGHSIVGQGVIMGGNVRTTVRRLDDRKPISRFGDFVIRSSSLKAGSIIGDGCRIGSSVVLGPLTILGRDVVIEPCLHVRGYVPPNTYVKTNWPL